MSAQEITTELTRYAIEKLRENMSQIRRCLALLTPEQIWQRPNEVSNAIGNLVIHLRGNVGQWIVEGLGDASFPRDRPAEFAQRDFIPTETMLADFTETMDLALAVIDALEPDQLVRQYEIQGYRSSGAAVLVHVVEHFSFHTGQIIYATKMLTNQDLSLFDAHGQRIDGRQKGGP